MKSWYLIITIFLWVPSVPFAQESEEFIYWSEDYKLKWTDFDMLAERFSEHAAFSVTGFESEYEFTGQQFEAVIKTFFNKSQSWSKSWTSTLLLHEQGHFDLAEVYGRKFRKEVKAKMETGSLTPEKFEEINDQIVEALEEAQKQYDEATNLSMDYRSQLEWTNRILEQLNALRDYADPKIIVQRQHN